MIVADTNVIAYLFFQGEWTEQSRAALIKDPDWIAPYLWRSEFLNVLATYIRSKMMTTLVAKRIMRVAEILMRGREYMVPSVEVLEQVTDSGCSAYDCEFASLAKTMNIQLLTTDKKLISAFPGTTVSLTDFVSF